MKLNLKWKTLAGSLALVLDNTIVGSVEESMPGEKQWFAYGCDVDWQDVSLSSHTTEAKAKRAVEDWVRENS